LREQKVIGLSISPVDDANDFSLALAILPAHLDRYPIPEQAVNFGIGVRRQHGRAITDYFGGGITQCIRRQMRIQLLECCPQTVWKHRVAHCDAALGPTGAERLVVDVDVAPAE
jgi:hypothetical protein